MKTTKGPAIFLAQFADDQPPFNSLAGMAEWASSLGYKAVQIPTWDSRLIDLDKAAESKTYCDELKGTLADHNLEVSELSTHLQGQLVAVHPAYEELFKGFAPKGLNKKQRNSWAVDQVKKAAVASKNLGINVHATFSGALVWPYFYNWPQRPSGLIEKGFQELANRWEPILNHFDEQGVDVCYEVHAGEDLHDGTSFEMFYEATNKHNRVKLLYDPSHFVLQQLDYLAYIDHYHEFIRMFHVKDAEFNPNGKSGVYGGYQDWGDRPGRFRSIGDGQVDFQGIFSKLTQYGYDGWAVLEWECCIKSPEQGAREGAEYIKDFIIEATEKSFDDFADAGISDEEFKNLLGIEE
ncbi:sugar phosphate isomerase/epimerase family protein [Roseivirga misakiensis]|uniref:AP endonuclease n=1 Tax=Roseivirga misakiensis TaxID=1563681 RepID=A0A1E5T4H0_9BACT|nr:sugar phosphate isomerase/epimerase family protein [Roseivirga misakiensis]OEK06293.1 AP endonuclease [Roseivirga misakiensis]